MSAMGTIRCLFFLVLLAALSPAFAVQPDEVLADATLETRARGLSRELRCMVCQNQSIDDSDAPLARDLRILVRDRLTAGDSDRQVLDFLVARYGEFVLLTPRLSWHTVLLWSAPGAVLLAGAFGLVLLVRRRRTQSVTADALRLTAAERERIAALVQDGRN